MSMLVFDLKPGKNQKLVGSLVKTFPETPLFFSYTIILVTSTTSSGVEFAMVSKHVI